MSDEEFDDPQAVTDDEGDESDSGTEWDMKWWLKMSFGYGPAVVIVFLSLLSGRFAIAFGVALGLAAVYGYRRWQRSKR